MNYFRFANVIMKIKRQSRFLTVILDVSLRLRHNIIITWEPLKTKFWNLNLPSKDQ